MSPASSASDEGRSRAAAEATGAAGASRALGEEVADGPAQGRAHFQEQLRALETNALGGLDYHPSRAEAEYFQEHSH